MNVQTKPGLLAAAAASAVEAGHTAEQRVALLILGMHRSGTSAFARVLSLLGAALPRRIMAAGPGNEAGHWEPAALAVYHDTKLAELGSRWDDWRKLDVDALSMAKQAKMRAEITLHIAEDYGEAPFFVLKDPRLCRFAPLYERLLADMGVRARFVLPLRNPLAVIASLAKRNGMTEGFASLLWLRHVLDAEAATRDAARVILSYESLLDDWPRAVETIASRLGIAWPRPPEQARAEIDAFLSGSHRHFAPAADELAARGDIAAWVREAYDALLLLERDPDEPSALAALDRIRGEFEAACPAFGEAMFSELAARERRFEEERDRLRAHAAEDRRAFAEERDRLAAEATERERKFEEERDRLRADVAQSDAERMRAIEQYVDRLKTAEQDRVRLQGQVTCQENIAKRLEAHARELGSEVSRLEAVNNAIYSSTSWRATAPLRMASILIRASARIGTLFRLASHALRADPSEVARILKIRWRLHFPESISRRACDPVCPEILRMPSKESIGRVLILTTRHSMFVAQLAQRTLATLGFEVTIRTEELESTAVDYEHIIVISPQVFSQLPAKYTAFQMEQTTSPRWFTPEYITALRNAGTVLDYSVRNIEFLRSNDFPYQQLYYVRLSPNPDYAAMNGISLLEAPKKYDVLFYGDDNCDRRRGFLQRLRANFSVRVLNNTFGCELIDAILAARVVVNIHYYESALLETTRINEVLSLGTPVVSEKSIDCAEYPGLGGVVDFVDVGDAEAMVRAVTSLLASESEYAQRVSAIKAYAESASREFEFYFRRYLLSEGLIEYREFAATPDTHVFRDGMIPARLCLSLPETPERRSKFLQQRPQGFCIVDGLRRQPPWRGCALSYKHIFSVLSKYGCGEILICEDDVVLPEDFEQRFSIIRSFLSETSRPWDVFSGFIADVSPETTIIDVVEHQGMEYVFLDKTVSMVFNVFRKPMIDYLALYDESNSDIERNTIDRYMQKSEGARIVTTLPFLVQHHQESQSTLWGASNLIYVDMVHRSESLLAKLVAEFKSSRRRAQSVEEVA